MKHIQTYERFLPDYFYKEVEPGKKRRGIGKQIKDYFTTTPEEDEESEFEQDVNDEYTQEEEEIEEPQPEKQQNRRNYNNMMKNMPPPPPRRNMKKRKSKFQERMDNVRRDMEEQNGRTIDPYDESDW